MRNLLTWPIIFGIDDINWPIPPDDSPAMLPLGTPPATSSSMFKNYEFQASFSKNLLDIILFIFRNKTLKLF